MRAFVTGSTGLLGNNLVRTLVADGHEVFALTRSLEKFQRMLGDTPATPIQGDILESAALSPRLEGIDVVFHTAAYFRESFGPGNHEAMLQATNIDATLALMKLADQRGVSAFVHTSSSGTIGKKPDGSPGDEDTPPAPRQLENLYFRSKYDGEQQIRAWTPTKGLRVIEILPGWMFGPGDTGPTAAGKLLLDYFAGKIPAVPPGGTSIVDARDVAQAMLDASHARHGSRYAVAGRYLSLREVVDTIAAVSATRPPRFDLPAWAAKAYARFDEWLAALLNRPVVVSYEGVRIMAEKIRIDSSRAQRELGATFRPFEETVRDELQWYVAHDMLKVPHALGAGLGLGLPGGAS